MTHETKHTPSIEWCAGLFDGEGWVCVHHRKAKDRLKVRADLMIGIVNTEIVLLEPFVEKWGGRIRPRKGTALSRLPLFEWRVECQKAENALTDLIPFLRGVKRERAIAAIKVRNSIQPMQRRANGTFRPKAA